MTSNTDALPTASARGCGCPSVGSSLRRACAGVGWGKGLRRGFKRVLSRRFRRAAKRRRERASVPEMPDAGKYHGEAPLIGGGYDFRVAHRAAGLDDGRCAGIGRRQQAVSKRKEGVRGGGRTRESLIRVFFRSARNLARLPNREPYAIDANSFGQRRRQQSLHASRTQWRSTSRAWRGAWRKSCWRAPLRSARALSRCAS